MAKDDKVGYGRPPLHTRFKEGQSGNPKGRPRKRLNLIAEIQAELSESVTMTIKGRPVKVSKLRALLRASCANALKGDRHALETLLTWAARSSADAESDKTEFAPGDDEIIQGFLARLGGQRSGEGGGGGKPH